jgi:ketosteroid isomerase-like protein
MGQQEVDLATEAYAAFNRGDLDGAMQRIDPDIEWHMSNQFTRTSRVFHGHAGVREVFEIFTDVLEGFRAEPHAVHDAGAAVIAEVTVSGVLRGTADPTTYELVHVWTMRHRLAVRLDVYATLDEARAATGITPPAASSDSISEPGSGRANR